jgi:hypothetical protein
VRRRIIAIVLPAAVLFAVLPAHAGGSWLEIVPGSSVDAGGSGPWDVWGAWGGAATMRAVGNDWPDGVYETYVRSEDGGPLVRVGEAVAGPANNWVGAISTSFEVPTLPRGRYVILVCVLSDPPCSDVATEGWMVIGETPEIAQLALSVDLLQDEVEVLRQAKSTRAVKLEVAQAGLARLEGRIASLRDEMSDLEEQLGFARGQRDSANEDAVEAGELATRSLADARTWRLIGMVSLGALLILLIAGWLRNRGTVRIKIPDSPEELIMFGAPKESPPGPKRRST